MPGPVAAERTIAEKATIPPPHPQKEKGKETEKKAKRTSQIPSRIPGIAERIPNISQVIPEIGKLDPYVIPIKLPLLYPAIVLVIDIKHV